MTNGRPIPVAEAIEAREAGLSWPDVARYLSERHGERWQSGSVLNAVRRATSMKGREMPIPRGKRHALFRNQRSTFASQLEPGPVDQPPLPETPANTSGAADN